MGQPLVLIVLTLHLLPHLSHWLSKRDRETLAGRWGPLLAFGKQASESLNGDSCLWHKLIMRFNFNKN